MQMQEPRALGTLLLGPRSKNLPVALNIIHFHMLPLTAKITQFLLSKHIHVHSSVSVSTSTIRCLPATSPSVVLRFS